VVPINSATCSRTGSGSPDGGSAGPGVSGESPSSVGALGRSGQEGGVWSASTVTEKEKRSPR
jgi:hypothetical protein